MLRYICVAFALWTSFLAAGLSEDEIKSMRKFMTDIANSCMKEYDVSKEDYEKAKKDKDMSSIDPCFIACLMKGNGLIDSKGMFDEKAGNGIAEKFMKSPEDIAKAKKITDICKTVNEQDVSDGDKGCERAVLLTQCLIENLAQ